MADARAAALLLLVALALGAGGGARASASVKPWLCPPKQFDSVPNLDLAKFISAPWFVQQQLATKSQPTSHLFCVRAVYKPLDPANLSKGVRVCNFANAGGVNKNATGTCRPDSPINLQAMPWPVHRSDPDTAASKLLVGPAAVLASKSPDDLAKPPAPGQTRLAGPYWVVATGPSKTPGLGYDWAIVSGGAPSQATDNDACIPPAKTDSGLWLFSRSPVAPKADLAAMLAAAQKLRLDVKKLLPVAQTGCTYT